MYYSLLCGLYLYIYPVYASKSSNGLPGTTYKKWTWTKWFDTDSGERETETYESIVARGWNICRGGKLIGCECKRDDTKEILSNGDFFNTSHILGTDLQCKLNGIECHNILCMNFEVRFLCEDMIIESGSAVFYFLMLVVPVAVILFRLYCWDIMKKRIKKRHCSNQNTSRSSQLDVIDMSVFDPPSYDDLFGSQTYTSIGDIKCNNCNHLKNTCHSFTEQSNATAQNPNSRRGEFSSVDCSCECHKIDNCIASGFRGDSRFESNDDYSSTNAAYIHDNETNDNTGSRARTTSISINVISGACIETPPPTYSEALVILKRTEGLDATHL
ncbi:uncharacterized protein LOC127737748 isoform X3 [Mytilus californianus]|uniref:uncharacterized protein LOC127737748 isoform X3 n=1 Tax=Mytilus californianus TaxID=6549 RepID=UPI0022454CB4|nr:uncharacterized protein LOC127737748 isoform X3 [Mytilus californianus]